MKIAAGFLMAVGCIWTLFVVWLFLTIAGVAGPPESWVAVTVYWGGMLVGPLMLIIGALLLLRGICLWTGAILAELGCVILTGFVLYNTIDGIIRRGPLEAPPPYSFFIVLLLFMLFSDIAGYRIYRAILEKT